MAAPTLYDDDIVAWTDEQVAALRAFASTPAARDNAIDWDNIIEEIEAVGRSQVDAVESLLFNVLAHLIKIHSDTASLSVRVWQIEVGNYRQQARRRFVNSMRQKIDIEALWSQAFEAASRELMGYERSIRPGIPELCPYTIDELLDPEFPFEDLVRRLPGFGHVRSGA